MPKTLLSDPRVNSATTPNTHRERLSPQHMSLATAIDQIACDETLPKQGRIHTCSSLRTYARCIRLTPEMISVSVDFIRPTLRDLTPAKTRTSSNRLGGVRAALGFALDYANAGEGIRPHGKKLTAELAQLLSVVECRWRRIALQRFFGYCTRAQIKPADVNDETVRGYYNHLVNSTLAYNPRLSVRQTRYAWNFCSTRYASWPKRILAFTVRAQRSRDLDASFKNDIDHYTRFLQGTIQHPIAGHFIVRPLRRSSLKQHIRAICRCAQAARSAGMQPRSLEHLVQAGSIDAVKKYLYERKPPISARYIHDQILALELAAKRWTLRPIERRQSPPRTAEARVQTSFEKFRQILELLQTESLPQLLGLPDKLMAMAIRSDIRAGARMTDAQAALGLEILLMIPILPGQLAALRTGIDILGPSQSDDVITISVPCPMEPSRLLRYNLPGRSSRLWQVYQAQVLYPSQDKPGGWLFPSRSGGHRQAYAFSEVISRKIWKHVGVKLTPRAIRFLSGTLYLIRHPNDYETVRRAMGHKAIAHTRRMFSAVRVVNSVMKFDSLLAT